MKYRVLRYGNFVSQSSDHIGVQGFCSHCFLGFGFERVARVPVRCEDQHKTAPNLQR